MIENHPGNPPENTWENIQHGLDKDLFKWYHESIENQAVEPPEDAWENIENQLDRGLFQWYSQEVENHQDDPPATVWSNIQDEIDIAETWKRISQKLDKTLPKNAVMIYAAAAVLLIFLMIHLFMPFQSKKEIPVMGEVNEYVSEDNNVNQFAQESPDFPEADSKAESGRHPDNNMPEPSMGKVSSKSAITPPDDPLHATAASFRGNNLLTGSEAPPQINKINPRNIKIDIAFNSHTDKLASLTQPGRSFEKEDSAPIQKKHYYVGLSGEVGQSWLLSQKTSYSIQKSPYSTAIPNQGKSFGVVGGIILNDRLDFQMEGLIKNENGQTYKEYQNGQVMNNRIYLDYSSLNMLGRYQIFQNNFKLPLSHHALLGIYGSYLKHASETYNGTSNNLRYAYKNYDLGFILGYELDAQISPQFKLSTGFRFDPGLINIYNGMPGLPKDFNKTYSSSFNINIALTCIITKSK